MQFTEAELESYLEAYSHAPWGELLDKEDTRVFLSDFYTDQNSSIVQYRSAPDASPYLYVHFRQYDAATEKLLADEFGPEALYPAADLSRIRQALIDYRKITYLADVHADKSVPIPDSLKPRLDTILPALLKKSFAVTKSDAIVCYTHRASGTFRAIHSLDPAHFSVHITPYSIIFNPATHTSESTIDHLELVVILNQRSPIQDD
jgi:hypothetical protein